MDRGVLSRVFGVSSLSSAPVLHTRHRIGYCFLPLQRRNKPSNQSQALFQSLVIMLTHAPSDSRDGSQVLSVASSDASSGIDHVAEGNAVPKVAVGLSESKYSTRQRKLLDLVNKLHNTGIQSEIDLPQICVIGSQSAGKSSLIESISGVSDLEILIDSLAYCYYNVPPDHASKICGNLCPTECRLSYSSKPWECRIFLRFLKDRTGADINPVRNVPFGPVMYSQVDIEGRLRRAQLAILSPDIDPSVFISSEQVHPTASSVGAAFSENYISVEISGPEITNLSFCDLPGMIANVREGHDESDIDLQMITSYIKKPSCIILLTVTCETDFENQGAMKLAKEFDPQGKRTIGVLTKPDRIEPGEEEKWLSFVRGETEALQKGWFCVKQPSPAELSERLTWKEARRREEAFFTTKEPWCFQDVSTRSRFGTARLTNQLSDILSKLISDRLPSIQSEIQTRLQKTNVELQKLPEEPSDDPAGALVAILVEFGRDVTRNVDGVPGAGGLVQQLRAQYLKFRKAIRHTAPNFRPFKRKFSDVEADSLPDVTFLPEDSMPSPKGIVYYDDDIARLSNEAITRELPRNVPFIVKKQLIGETIDLWEESVEALIVDIKRILVAHMRVVVDAKFGQHQHGGLHSAVWNIISDRIKQSLESAATTIRFLYQLEKDQTFTLNDHYLSDYKEKFKTYYSAARRDKRSGKESSFLTGLAKGLNDSISISRNGTQRTAFAENLGTVLAKLAEMGASVSPLDLAKLLETDSTIESLEVMAEVRAYYQGK
ncbi:P-loop containing nucleoside triphosphate hydrolase protein [Ceratobasidium sp. AG-I]|nr:P-loop containing nucleoside triphosphate hydrolase protein [Ceratobasidium sp. AG-I]